MGQVFRVRKVQEQGGTIPRVVTALAAWAAVHVCDFQKKELVDLHGDLQA
jgi:hypothetical protein